MSAPPAPLGLDSKQLRLYVVRPALQAIGLWSPTAENLVLGTGIVESKLTYLKQLGAGPALGLFQMEPFTHNDIWRTTLWGKELGMKVGNLIRPWGSTSYPDPAEMISNLNYAAAMCRVHYRRIRAPLPGNEPEGLAGYWKQYYNTPLGAGTVEKALPAFRFAVDSYEE